MCLGAQARAANEAAKRQYEFDIANRERKWMNDIGLTRLEHIQYEQGINATNLGLANTYADIYEKKGDLIGDMHQADQDNWKEFLEKSPSSTLAASGQTGRSVDRIATLDLAEYLRNGSQRVNELADAFTELDKAGAQAAGAAKQQQMQMFAKQAFVKSPDFAPPAPVMQNVGAAAFTEALSIASPFIAASDRKIKENIKKLGESISGLGIYKFNYKGDSTKWIGTMADEVKKINPKAVITMKNGYEGVRYDLIDIKMRRAIA